MFLKQADIFWGLDHDFVKEMIERSSKKSHNAGEYLFKEGSPADHFYILIKGRIKISIGGACRMVHVVNHAGEAFGWSSLVERNFYSASAFCAEPTDLIVFEKPTVDEIICNDPVNGIAFIKRIAGLIGNRLVNAYKMLSSAQISETFDSFGTRQVMDILHEEPEP
ncbi:MAG: Crp/Fnr family transcriptional regulator [Desulfobacterales bacterium]|nr:Crp/Fnr family transcriptional regulator [Desulfobacterales bacterium]